MARNQSARSQNVHTSQSGCTLKLVGFYLGNRVSVLFQGDFGQLTIDNCHLSVAHSEQLKIYVVSSTRSELKPIASNFTQPETMNSFQCQITIENNKNV